MAKPKSSKSKVFALPPRNPYTERTPKSGQGTPTQAPALTLEIRDVECAYMVGALLDGQRKAQEMQAEAEAVGAINQAAVFSQKAHALGALAQRVAKAITARGR